MNIWKRGVASQGLAIDLHHSYLIFKYLALDPHFPHTAYLQVLGGEGGDDQKMMLKLNFQVSR